jgi:integrase
LTPFFRGEVVTKIGARHIEAWKIKRAALISAQTANIEAETLRLIFRYALNDLRLLIENPAESIKRRKVRSAERLIPTKEDFRRLVAELRSGHKATGEAADFVEFLAYSGMRRAEAACVCWRDEKRHLENQFPDDILALKEYIELGERELMDESVERLRRIVEDLRSSSDNDDDTNATEKGP